MLNVSTKRTTLLTCLLFIATYGHPQEKLAKRFVDYTQSVPVEKAYLHTSRETLTIGDTLYYSAYVLNGMDHTPSPLSGLLHVELISPAGPTQASKLKIDPLGRANGDFAISDDMVSGNYTLRAFTNYQLNFDGDYLFSKSIKVLPRADSAIVVDNKPEIHPEIKLSLFPEGGQLVAGDYNSLAFKATNELGRPVAITGAIVNSKGDERAKFKSQHDGMGMVQMRFEPNETYSMLYEHEGVTFTEAVPDPLPSGYLLQVRNASDRVIVMVKSQQEVMDGTFMLVQCRGSLIHVLKPRPGASYLQFALDRTELPTGIIQLTFFDKNQQATAERLIYNENPNEQSHLEIITDQSSFAKRSRVSMELLLEQVEENEPALASLSTTVLPKDLFVAPKQTIASYLLFTSDLKGRIHEPTHYLDSQKPERLAHIDLLMMTHGWRKFDWEKVMAKEAIEINYPVETGIAVKGKVTSFINRSKGVESNLYLSFLEDPLVRVDTVSLPDGSFRFDGLAFSDTLRAYVKTLSANEKRREKGKINSNTFIKILEEDSPPLQKNQYVPYRVTPIDQAQIDRSEKLFDIAAAFDGSTVLLDEITIEGRKDDRDDPIKSRSIIYGTPSSRVMLDSVPAGYFSLFQYIQNLPGVRVMGSAPNFSVIIRGAQNFQGTIPPLYLLNGFEVDQSFVNGIPVDDVLFIDVLRGSDAAVYGSRGAGGVVAVYTRRGNETRPGRASTPLGLVTFPLVGFTAPREFYMPDYSDPTENELIRPDFRSTIYWNPLLEVEGGYAEDHFYTSDEAGAFVIYSEGIGVDGKIYQGSAMFEVR